MVMFSTSGIAQHRPPFGSFLFWNARRSVGTLKKPRPIRLILEPLESRIEPSPFTPTGALGNLAPHHQVAFNTDTGQYRVDNGPWLSGGILSANQGHTSMLFDFSTINLAHQVQITALGSHSLGLLATGNINVAADFYFGGTYGLAGQ